MTDTPLRLVLVVNIPRFFLSHRLPVALAATDDGYDVHVITSNADPAGLERIRAHGLSVHPIPLDQHGRSPRSEFRAAVALLRVLAKLRPDVVHLVTIKPVIYGGLSARMLGIPRTIAALTGLGRAFASDRGPGWPLVAALRLALGGARTKLILQNTDDLRMVDGLRLLPAGSTYLIPGSGVDPDVFTARPEPDVPTVLHAGRLMRSKGLDEFVTVARRLAGRARFVIAGYSEAGAPDAVPVEELERLDRDGTIVWLGNRQDMPDVIAAASMVVLPTTYPEGIPRILIEAAASARPTVAFDVPGCREVCLDEESGLLVPPGDVDGLTEAVRRLLDDDALRARLGRRGREIVLERFSLGDIVARTLEIYREGSGTDGAG